MEGRKASGSPRMFKSLMPFPEAHASKLEQGLRECTEELPISWSGDHEYSGIYTDRATVLMTGARFVETINARKADVESKEFENSEGNLYLCQMPVWQKDVESPLGQLQPVLPRIPQEALSHLGCSNADLLEANLWMNSHSPSQTNAHYDAHHGILVVLRGQKRVRLASPAQSPMLRPSFCGGEAANHCQAKFFASKDEGSEGKAAEFQEFFCGPGDVLIIPEGWWHAVQSKKHTVAVNWWLRGQREHWCTPDTAFYAFRTSAQYLTYEAVKTTRLKGILAALKALLPSPDGSTTSEGNEADQPSKRQKIAVLPPPPAVSIALLTQPIQQQTESCIAAVHTLLDWLKQSHETPSAGPVINRIFTALSFSGLNLVFGYAASWEPGVLVSLIEQWTPLTCDVVTARWEMVPGVEKYNEVLPPVDTPMVAEPLPDHRQADSVPYSIPLTKNEVSQLGKFLGAAFQSVELTKPDMCISALIGSRKDAFAQETLKHLVTTCLLGDTSPSLLP